MVRLFLVAVIAAGCINTVTVKSDVDGGGIGGGGGTAGGGTAGGGTAGGAVAVGGGGGSGGGAGSGGGTGGSGLHPSYVGTGGPVAGTLSNQGVVTASCPDNLATIVSWTIPAEIDTHFMTHAEVTVTNTGTTTWRAADQFSLGNPADSDPFVDNARVSLPDDVSPGATVIFIIDMRGPDTPGAYLTQWQMVEEQVCFFGDLLSATVQVDAPVAHPICDNPAPHGLDEFTAVVHNVGPTRTTLDSTPKVCDRDYCSQIGFTDSRTCCPPRPEGHPDVDVCNEAIVGRAADTGRVGPTWTFGGLGCGDGGTGNCEDHPDNAFLLWVFGSGTAIACGNLNGVCGQVVVP